MFYNINNILQYLLGIRIAKVGRKMPKKPIFKKTIPLHIEFAGLPGVGKTTLFEELSKAKTTPKWGLAKIYLYLNRNRLKNKEKIQQDEIYQLLLTEKLDNIGKDDYSIFWKFESLRYFYQVIQLDFGIQELNSGYTLLTDGGVLHNFGEELESIYSTHAELIEGYLQNRAVVYCYSSPEKIAEQVLKRYKETGFLLPQHKTEDFKQLIALQKDMLSRSDEMISRLDQVHIPVLRVNTSDEASLNIKKIEGFIKNLQEGK